jgi:dihydrofolate reductase
MGRLIYSMSVSVDGYIAGPDDDISWTAPSDELHRFHNERVQALGAHLLGRRLYETMLVWETTDDADWDSDIEREFAAIWKGLPRIVFSTTLHEVQGSATLATGDLAEEVQRLKEEPGGDIGVGGAGLAAGLARLGLIDEYELFVYPTAVGGGTPFFPGGVRIDLELVETRTFGDRVVYLRYRKV